MFVVVTSKSKIISCQERLFTKRKAEIVFPSELNSLWLKNIQKAKELYNKSISLNNKISEPLNNLANLYNSLNEFENSIKYY